MNVASEDPRHHLWVPALISILGPKVHLGEACGNFSKAHATSTHLLRESYRSLLGVMIDFDAFGPTASEAGLRLPPVWLAGFANFDPRTLQPLADSLF